MRRMIFSPASALTGGSIGGAVDLATRSGIVGDAGTPDSSDTFGCDEFENFMESDTLEIGIFPASAVFETVIFPPSAVVETGIFIESAGSDIALPVLLLWPEAVLNTDCSPSDDVRECLALSAREVMELLRLLREVHLRSALNDRRFSALLGLASREAMTELSGEFLILNSSSLSRDLGGMAGASAAGGVGAFRLGIMFMFPLLT